MKIKKVLLVSLVCISNSILSQNTIKLQEFVTSQRMARPYDDYKLVGNKTYKTVINKDGNILSLRKVANYNRGRFNKKKNEFSIINLKKKYMVTLNTSQSVEQISVFKNNNSLKYYDKIYSAKFTRKGITVFRNYMANNRNYLNETFYKDNFESNSDGNIDTHKIEKYKLGCGLIAIKTKSQFDKKRHLFISKTQDSKLLEVNLSKISNLFDKQNVFNGQLNTSSGTKRITTDWGIKSIFKHNNIVTVFLIVKDNLLPVQIDLNTSVQKVIKNSILSDGVYFSDNRFMNERSGDVFLLPFSGGFINTHSDLIPNELNQPYPFKLKLYDENLKLIKRKTLHDFYFVNHVMESKGYIVVGGYTKSKGYKGYQNPILQIINKSTMKITQTIVIPQKNGAIDYIGYNLTGQILVDVSSPFLGYQKNEDITRVSKIIIDEIDANGKLKNNLFNN